MRRRVLSVLVVAVMLSLAAESQAMAQNVVGAATSWAGKPGNVRTAALWGTRLRTNGAQSYFPPIGWKYSNLKVKIER
jgi:hypothetical protein